GGMLARLPRHRFVRAVAATAHLVEAQVLRPPAHGVDQDALVFDVDQDPAQAIPGVVRELLQVGGEPVELHRPRRLAHAACPTLIPIGPSASTGMCTSTLFGNRGSRTTQPGSASISPAGPITQYRCPALAVAWKPVAVTSRRNCRITGWR